MLPADTSRCFGERGAVVCPRRNDCERHSDWHRGTPGLVPVAVSVCATPDLEAWIPRPCAGQRTRVSNRPHPLCRGDSKHQPCRRWQYGTPDGITPDWRDVDGHASCGDRVFHVISVGDAAANCAPTR